MTVRIAGQEFRFWEEVEIVRAIDVHPTVGFSAPFESQRKEFRSTFKPFSFQSVEIAVGGDPLFSGTMLGPDPRVTPESRTVAVSAYSRAAVLEDSDIPASLVPFQSAGLTLRDIATRIATPFGIDVIFTSSDGAKFRRARPVIDVKAQDFLAELARQRGFVISSNEDGDLLFQKSTETGRPVARLQAGASPTMTVTATFNHQEYFSEITGFVPTRGGRVGLRYTLKNPRLTGVLRPKSCRLDDTEKGDAPAAVQAKLARMFANMVSYVVNVPTWRDPQGALWKPNTTVTLLAPDAMVYRETELLVREVSLRQNASEQVASLGLVLPGAFSGETPSSFPWDES